MNDDPNRFDMNGPLDLARADTPGSDNEDRDARRIDRWEAQLEEIQAVEPDPGTVAAVREFVRRPPVNWPRWVAVFTLLLAIALSFIFGTLLNPSEPHLPQQVPGQPVSLVPTPEEYAYPICEVIDKLQSAQDHLDSAWDQLESVWDQMEVKPTKFKPCPIKLYNFADPSNEGSIMWYLTDWDIYDLLFLNRVLNRWRARYWNNPKNALLANDKSWLCGSECCSLAILTDPMVPKKIIIELDPEASPLTEIAVCALPQNYQDHPDVQSRDLQCTLPMLVSITGAVTLPWWHKVLQREIQPAATKVELAVPQSFQQLGEAYIGFLIELKSRHRVVVLQVSLMGTVPNKMANGGTYAVVFE